LRAAGPDRRHDAEHDENDQHGALHDGEGRLGLVGARA